VTYLFSLIGAIISLIILVFWLAVIGLIVLFVASIFIPNKYSEDSVIQRWSSLLAGQAGLASEVLDRIEKELNNKKLPYKNNRKEISTSLISGNLHDFIVVRMRNDYSCYISAVPQGNDLCVTWLMQDHMIRGLYKIPFIGAMMLAVFKRYTFAMNNEAISFAMATQDAAATATENIMDEKVLDKTHFDRKSSGKLGPL